MGEMTNWEQIKSYYDSIKKVFAYYLAAIERIKTRMETNPSRYPAALQAQAKEQLGWLPDVTLRVKTVLEKIEGVIGGALSGEPDHRTRRHPGRRTTSELLREHYRRLKKQRELEGLPFEDDDLGVEPVLAWFAIGATIIVIAAWGYSYIVDRTGEAAKVDNDQQKIDFTADQQIELERAKHPPVVQVGSASPGKFGVMSLAALAIGAYFIFGKKGRR